MEFRGKPGSFSTYLKSGTQTDQSSSQAPQPVATPLELLRLLAIAPNRQMPLARFAQASGLDAILFQKHLKELVDSGFTSITGSALEESVSLTELGNRVVGLAG